MLTRRQLLTGAGLTPLLVRHAGSSAAAQDPRAAGLPPSIAALTSLRGEATPVTSDERLARIERARRLMASAKIDAILLTGGTSLTYFTGLRWGNSERLMA